jgi:S-adenosylmethionine decarboxylase proenzyme
LQPHVLVDLHGCSPARLNDLEGIRRLLYDTARSLGCTTIGDIFHQFSPHGVTGVVAIAESHLSVHTWVEEGYAALDLFLCNSELEPDEIYGAVDAIVAFFGATRRGIRALSRGPSGVQTPETTPRA